MGGGEGVVGAVSQKVPLPTCPPVLNFSLGM